MTGILDLIRNSTVETVMAAGTTFDAPRMPARRAPKDMVRIVEGATDLTPPARSGGVARVSTIPRTLDTQVEKFTPTGDLRSPRQIETMISLHMQLAELDAKIAEDAVAYTTKMTLHNAWTPGKQGNASRWIGNMITKVRELKARPVVAPVVADTKPAFDAYDDIPTGYYALVEDAEADIIKFYRVNHHKSGRLYVDACASDERHPVRVWATRKAVLDGIRAMGWKASTALYGSKIGSCGRCHRTLTDADSRARGIGPDCWGKM